MRPPFASKYWALIADWLVSPPPLPIRQRDHRRIVLVVRRPGVDDELVAEFRAVGVEQLRAHRLSGGVADALADVAPDRNEAAGGERRDRRLVLRAELGGVGEDLVAPFDRYGHGRLPCLR
jgi:hypothetical protein